MVRKQLVLTEQDRSRVIEMAWEDHTPFDAIEQQFGLSESQTIALMRSTLTEKSFVMWRRRVTGRRSKHAQRANQMPLKHRAKGQGKLPSKPKRKR